MQFYPHEDIYAIEVYKNSQHFNINTYGNGAAYLDYYVWMGEWVTEQAALPPGNWQILGEVIENFIDPIILKILKLGGREFYSLLAANGLYFVNPMGEKPNSFNKPNYRISTLIWQQDLWQSYEDKLIQKALIIKKI
jgi:hypothetical protein